jgi:hypothetical protein
MALRRGTEKTIERICSKFDDSGPREPGVVDTLSKPVAGDMKAIAQVGRFRRTTTPTSETSLPKP